MTYTDAPPRHPLGKYGYAPGGYICLCLRCQHKFDGEEHAYCCEPCAGAAKKSDALLDERRKRQERDLEEMELSPAAFPLDLVKIGNTYYWGDAPIIAIAENPLYQHLLRGVATHEEQRAAAGWIARLMRLPE